MGELDSELSPVNFYLNCLFSVRLSQILMQLGTNDTRARGYIVTEQIVNICINYCN